MNDDVNAAIARTQAALPGWWFAMGRCGLTCHASVGPDRAFIAEPVLSLFDSGFHADLPNPSTCAAALDDATSQAVAALRKYKERAEIAA